jgi:hypothetical protein
VSPPQFQVDFADPILPGALGMSTNTGELVLYDYQVVRPREIRSSDYGGQQAAAISLCSLLDGVSCLACGVAERMPAAGIAPFAAVASQHFVSLLRAPRARR